MRSGLPLAGGPDFFRAHRNSGALAVIGRDRVFRGSFSGRFAASQPPPLRVHRTVPPVYPVPADKRPISAGGRTRAMHSKGGRDNASVRPKDDRTRRRQDPAMHSKRGRDNASVRPQNDRTRRRQDPAMHSKGGRDNASVRPKDDRTRRRQNPAMHSKGSRDNASVRPKDDRTRRRHDLRTERNLRRRRRTFRIGAVAAASGRTPAHDPHRRPTAPAPRPGKFRAGAMNFARYGK